MPPSRNASGNSVAVAALLLGVVLLTGCGKSSSKPTAPAMPEVNTDPANANARILAQQIFGDSDKKSQVRQLAAGDGLSDWFLGELNGSSVVGRLNATGTVASHTGLIYRPLDIETLSASSPVPGGAIIVGAYDTDADNQDEVGFVTLVDGLGVVVSEQGVASTSSDVWFTAIAPLSDSVFVVVGGERTPSRTNPLVALFALTPSGALEKRQQAVLSSISGRTAYDVATDPADALAPSRRIYVVTELNPAGSATSNVVVYGMDIDPATLAPSSLAWNQTMTGKGIGTSERDVRVFGGALYLVGSAGDPDKGTPSNGGHWDSGLVARLSPTGTIEWEKVIKLTSHSERLKWAVPTANAVIALGEAANYFNTTSDDVFGYGWVARLAPADGALLSSFTFGDAGFSSGFISGYLTGSGLHVGGWSQQETNGGPFRAWWSAVDLNAVASMAPGPQPERARPGEAAVRDAPGGSMLAARVFPLH